MEPDGSCRWVLPVEYDFFISISDSNAMNIFFRRVIVRIARTRLGCAPFSIVSNNCWGAHVYQETRIPYTTPFVGLFLSPTSYLRLLSNFGHYLEAPIDFRSESCESWINERRGSRSNKWPIGCLGGDVEVHFMH